MNRTRAMELATRALVALALLLAGGAAVLWLAQRPWFEFRQIDVLAPDGGAPRHVTEASVRTAVFARSGAPLAGNFFTMRLADVRRRFESVPWVAQASVRRVWPNRLVVVVHEHRAIGVWSDGRVLSDRGRLFVANSAEAELDGPLAAFAGPASYAEAAALRFRDFGEQLAALSLAPTALEVSDRAAWSLTAAALDSEGQPRFPSTRFELGRDEPAGRLREQLGTIVTAWPRVVAQLGTAPTRIDARYVEGFAAAPAPKKSDSKSTR